MIPHHLFTHYTQSNCLTIREDNFYLHATHHAPPIAFLGVDWITFIQKLIWVRCEKGSKFDLNGEMEPRTEGLRPRTQKNPRPRPRTALPRADHLEAKNRSARRQGTGSSVLPKKVFTIFFRRSPKNKVCKKNFQAFYKISTIQKIVLSSSGGQGNFRGLEALRPRTSKCVLKDLTSVNGM